MTEEQLRDLGQHYKRQVSYRALCYKLASDIAGHRLHILGYGEAQAQEVAALDDLTVGVMLMADWGGNVPPELLARAHVVGVFTVPGSLEIH